MVGALAVLLFVVASAVLLWPDRDPDAADARDAAPAVSAPSTPPPTTASTTTTPTTTVPEGRPADAELLAIVDELKAFVSSVRGHPFEDDVEVRTSGNDEFDALLRAELGLDRDKLEREAARLLVLGLLTEDQAATYAEDRLEAIRGIDGLYGNGEIRMRGTEYTSRFRRVLVHELTHALDDQHFDIGRDAEAFPLESEGPTTLPMVVEGNAQRVEARWVESRPEEVQSQLGPATPPGRDDLDRLRTPAEHETWAKYFLGWSFVDHALDHGGEAVVDDQLRAPPPTTEQVFSTDAFDRGEVRVDVPPPPLPRDAELFDERPLGVSFWYQVLAYSTAELPREQVEEAVTGWGGDWQVSWEQSGLLCTRADIVGDTAADTAQLRDALRAWADATDGRVVVSDTDGRIRAEYCIPASGAAGEHRI